MAAVAQTTPLSRLLWPTELLRKKRIMTVMNLSFRQGYLNHISNPVLVFLRNLVMKYLPSLAMRSIKTKVWNYDPSVDIRNFD